MSEARGRQRTRSLSPGERRRHQEEKYEGDNPRLKDRDDFRDRDDSHRHSPSTSRLSPVRRRPHSHSHSPHRSPRRRHHSRSRSRSASPRRHHKQSKKRRRSRSTSSSSSSSDESSRGEHRRRKHGKDHEKGKHRHRSRSHSRERKHRKDKKDKKKKKKKSVALTSQWGKHGIISESDLYNKEPEFRAWLVEELMLNPETMSKDQTKKHFSKFVEDYNTATLPHEKYYAIEKYEAHMSRIRSGDLLPPTDGYDPNADLVAHTSKHKRAVVEQDSYLSKEQLMELRRVQNERIEVGKMKVLGLEIKSSMGVRMDGSAFD